MDYKPSFIPTLDISKGKAVLVRHGNVYKILGDPMEKAKFIAINEHFQVIDIDAAKGEGDNKALIKEITKKYPCYVGGGIRTYQGAVDFLNSSARRVIISTAISAELISKIPKDRLIVAFDVNEKNAVYKQGRKGIMDKNLFQLLDEYASHIEMITITFHQAEGTCNGIPEEQVREIKKYLMDHDYNIKLVVAGGIATIDEVGRLIDLGVVPQFGSGFWNGKFTLGDVYQCICEKVLKLKHIEYNNEPLIPTIVQSIDGQNLGLVFSKPDTVKLSADARVATFFSRDTSGLWIKGATSGNFHRISAIHYCCDGSSLRFIVDSCNNKFCHTGAESCFGYNDPARASLRSIQSLIRSKVDSDDEKSYTRALLKDGFKIQSKVLEEAQELVCAKTHEDIAHESADLIYFMMMLLQQRKIDIEDVERELNKRKFTILKDELVVQPRDPNEFTIGVILNNMPTQFVFEYLEAIFNTKIHKTTEDSRCLTYVCEEHPKIVIMPTKPKDISTLMNNELMDAVVSFEDVIINYSANAEKLPIKQPKTKQVSIAVCCKEEITMEHLKEENKKRKLLIMAEYVQLTNDWVTQNGLVAKIVPLSGSSEGWVASGKADMCTVVVDSGTTLRANNMKVLDTLVTTNINLFVHPKKKEMLYKLLKQ